MIIMTLPLPRLFSQKQIQNDRLVIVAFINSSGEVERETEKLMLFRMKPLFSNSSEAVWTECLIIQHWFSRSKLGCLAGVASPTPGEFSIITAR